MTGLEQAAVRMLTLRRPGVLNREASASDCAGWMLFNGREVPQSCREVSIPGMMWCLPGVT